MSADNTIVNKREICCNYNMRSSFLGFLAMTMHVSPFCDSFSHVPPKGNNWMTVMTMTLPLQLNRHKFQDQIPNAFPKKIKIKVAVRLLFKSYKAVCLQKCSKCVRIFGQEHLLFGLYNKQMLLHLPQRSLQGLPKLKKKPFTPKSSLWAFQPLNPQKTSETKQKQNNISAVR